MFNNNRHLNIFEHFTQKGSLPIENNVSRGLAILLNQNSLVLDRLIDNINVKCMDKKSSCSVPKPQKLSDKEIGIQQQITKIVQSYPNPQNIIGMTLTTSSPISMVENKYDDNNGLITDIVISCKDTLVVIEVKKNANDARLQLKQQVKSIAAEVVRQGGNLPDTELLDGTWEDIISILQDVYNISGSPICRMSITDFSEKLVVKEKVPVIHGGTRKYNNLQLVHGYCNRQYGKVFPLKGEPPSEQQKQEGCKTIRQLRLAEIS